MFSKPATRSSTRSSLGERVAPRTPSADEQHADPGRSAPLVGGAGGRRPARRAAAAGPSTRRRRRTAGRRWAARDCADRLDGAHLVVGALEATAADAGSGRALDEIAGVRRARRPSRRRGSGSAPQARPHAARRSARPASGRPRRPRASGPDQPEQPAVDGVGPGGGERHLVAAHAERLGDRLAGVVEDQPGVPGRRVQPPRVGVPLVQAASIASRRRRVQRLGGRGVEVARGEPTRRDSPR